ncbi:ACP phosphodiesterase [Corallincola platygyrae]
MLGDFVKGRQWQALPHDEQVGVLLHRQVDTFTDQHACVLEARRKLTKTRFRYSGIAVDMIFDHLLAKHWGVYEQQALHQFSQRCYRALSAHRPHWPVKMRTVSQRMTEYDWLLSYAEQQTIDAALNNIARRMTRAQAQANQPFQHTYQEWQGQSADFETLFHQFYRDLIGQLPSLQQQVRVQQHNTIQV